MLDILTVGSIAVSSAAVSYLYTRWRRDDDGCGSHHFEEYSIDWDESGADEVTVQTELGTERALRVAAVESAYCEHDGCREKETRSGGVKFIPTEAVCSSINPELEDAIEALGEGQP